MWTYRLRYIRCGKANCRTCTLGFGHGPYWYGYRHSKGRMYTKYFGKRPTSSFEMPSSTDELPVDNRWVFRGRMDERTALRILGFTRRPDHDSLLRRWRALVNEYHPDRGGDVRVCAAINVAYTFLK